LGTQSQKTTSSLLAQPEAMKQVGTQAATMGAGILAAYGVSTHAAMGFRDILKDVEIQSGATAEQMDAIAKSALSAEFVRLGKSGSDVANMYRRLASEGYDLATMKQMLMPITEATVALGTDEADTTKLMLNLMEQYKMSASEMPRIADAMTSALANTSYQGSELAEVMKYAGMAGSSLGWSLEETIAVTDRVIKVTGEASMAGTYFRGVVAAIRDPTKEMQDELAGVGISLEDLAKATEDPIALVDLLTKAHDRGANFANMFSVRALTAAEALVGESDSISSLIPKLHESGAAHDAAMEKMSNAGGAARSGAAALKNLGIAIGDALLPMIQALGPPLVSVIGFFSKIAASPVGKILTGIGVAIGGILLVAGGLLAFLAKSVISWNILTAALTRNAAAATSAAAANRAASAATGGQLTLPGMGGAAGRAAGRGLLGRAGVAGRGLLGRAGAALATPAGATVGAAVVGVMAAGTYAKHAHRRAAENYQALYGDLQRFQATGVVGVLSPEERKHRRAAIRGIVDSTREFGFQTKFGRDLGENIAVVQEYYRALGRTRAGGGPVRRGEAYVVGEAGQELFVPETSGYIYPTTSRHPRTETLGGVVNNYNYNLNVEGNIYGDAAFERHVKELIEQTTQGDAYRTARPPTQIL